MGSANGRFSSAATVPFLLQVWNINCINCHATAGQPRQNTNTLVLDTRVAELGISCEACHGPAADHIRANSDPRRRYALHRGKNADPTIVNPARLSSKKSSELCSQCHAIRYNHEYDSWLAHGFSYRPGGELNGIRPLPHHANLAINDELPPGKKENVQVLLDCFWNDGMVRVAGREYNALVESLCFKRGELSCLSCHSMHQSDPDDQLAVGMESNRACLQCHSSMVAKFEQHTHHKAKSSGSSCYNCHMPHTTYGLLKAIRSH
jgi:predicted CXXCH cytochrome family protein